MKKFKSLICVSAFAATALGAVPFAANAADGVVYGTMNIPYADFYANEGIGYEVDAVSSATTSKWSSNEEGGLVQGTFNEANADGTGKILGVTYPVAISQEDLDALGDNNYSFTALDSVPVAYKTVTVENGSASFSAVIDEDGIENGSTTLTVETTSVWGDYCVTIDNLSYERGQSESSIGKLYGCIVTDTDGNNYAMRHLENIWKNELGINVLESATDVHGAPMSYANFVGLNGATIDKITYITEKGYYVYDVNPDAYLAKKLTGSVSIADVAVADGKTSITADLPSDYDPEFTLNDLNGYVKNNNIIVFSDALAGSYSATVSDKNGVYESITVSFTLTTDSMPAAYSNGAIVKAEGADDADFANFIKNISSVSVNGTEYSASGRGAVQIVGEDGKIDLTANSRGNNVFEGSDSYRLVVKSAGYTKTLEFDLSDSDQPVSGTEGTGTGEASTTTTTSTDTAKTTTTTTTAKTNASAKGSSSTSSPKTGVGGVAVPAAVLAAAAAAAVVSKKKNK